MATNSRFTSPFRSLLSHGALLLLPLLTLTVMDMHAQPLHGAMDAGAVSLEHHQRPPVAPAPPILFDADGHQTDGRKSPFLGVLYSLAIPGMGEWYGGRFDRGKYPFITEIALWIGALGIDMYGDWVQDDARIFAQRHAGIDPTGKDDDFFVNIENYSSLAEYNNQRLIERRTEDLYADETPWQWSWDSEEARKEYKDLRIQSDELHNAVTFFVLGMVANRIWSAIQASSAVRRHNASLEERLTSIPAMQPRLRTYAGRVDGIEFRFSW